MEWESIEQKTIFLSRKVSDFIGQLVMRQYLILFHSNGSINAAIPIIRCADELCKPEMPFLIVFNSIANPKFHKKNCFSSRASQNLFFKTKM